MVVRRNIAILPELALCQKNKQENHLGILRGMRPISYPQLYAW